MGVTLAEPPAFCAACFAAKPGSRFVDLGSTYDGPVIRDDAGQPQTIDDNIVCEDCIAEAAAVLALAVDPKRGVELERDEALREARAWRDYAEGLERATAQRPEQPRRLPGRPRKQPERPLEAV